MQSISLAAHNFAIATTDAGGLTGAQPVEADIVNLVSDLAGKQSALTACTDYASVHAKGARATSGERMRTCVSWRCTTDLEQGIRLIR